MSDGKWGAIPQGQGIWRFSIWAPAAQEVALVLDDQLLAMQESVGHWTLLTRAEPDMAYLFRIDGEDRADPASRRQVQTLNGPSMTVDAAGFDWGAPWRGRPWNEAVIYEMHIGSYTPEGTFAAAIDRLPELADLGITVLNVMPVSQFEGKWGWGYDGVLIRAPQPTYGTPDDMRAFVRAAQELGMSVILDLVMNHFGPWHNYLPGYAPEFYTKTPTPWGAGIAFHQPMVRAFFLEAALGWLDEYRLDGFRLDAVHQIRDRSDPHFLKLLHDTIRSTDRGRPIHLVTEDERNLPHLRDLGYDAEWNDDWHNALHVALTGETQGYYKRFAPDPFGDLAHALANGQVDEGQDNPIEETRGAPAAHLPWTSFVNSNHTHDQIGNRPHGERLLTLVGEETGLVLHAALMLMPFVPMLFQGEEIGSEAPFPFFCDPPDEAAREAVRKGRAKELGRLDYDITDMPDPTGPNAMDMACPYPSSDPERARRWQALTRQLASLRASHVVPLLASGDTGPGSVTRHGENAFHASWAFNGGTLNMLLCLGAPATGATRPDTPVFSRGNPLSDDFAIDVWITS
ncbi:malto-oligosyltrehalose trehalohydrolase [Salipiger pallidus]|uniref:Malto-oligosyltrehalose trehalohydrolase n=1 Tax=Salipiger pallidus TaxID=1775170 RepID=A0A8J2ZM25_9RHOB|nr:malto-oligosyltrehalose trehalohydrolase [Salipiger pallidus]GGG79833.1 malto-oligosyltrehalose trehalohydrolase [Salipiger pallidus]